MYFHCLEGHVKNKKLCYDIWAFKSEYIQYISKDIICDFHYEVVLLPLLEN